MTRLGQKTVVNANACRGINRRTMLRARRRIDDIRRDRVFRGITTRELSCRGRARSEGSIISCNRTLGIARAAFWKHRGELYDYRKEESYHRLIASTGSSRHENDQNY